MAHTSSPRPIAGATQTPVGVLTVVLAYAVFASLWIFLSDRLVEWIFPDSVQIALVSTLKGWAFVLVTASLLYILLRRRSAKTGDAPVQKVGWRPLVLPLILAAIAIVGLTTFAIVQSLLQLEDRETVHLLAIAGLKAGQLTTWVVLAGLLALFIAAAAAVILRQRWQIAVSRREQQMQTEETVRRRLLFDQAGDGIVVVNADGGVNEANASFAAMLGCGLDEARTLHVWEWDTGWTRERVLAIFTGPIHQTLAFATHWRRKDGSQLAVEVTANRIELSGQYVAYCVCRDISQRVRAETELKESRENLLQAQRIAGIGQYVLDVGTGRWTSTEVLDEIFGIGSDYPRDVEGWLKLVADQDRASVGAHLRDDVLAGRKLFDCEYRIVRVGDGALRWLHGRGRLELDGEGRPIQMLGTIQDITARRQTEEQLLKLSLAVEQSPESVVITDLNANIEYTNEAFSRVTGYSREEAMGQNPRVLHSGNTPKATFDDLWATLSSGRSWKGEFHNRRKDGSEYIEFAIITPIRQPNGRITHYVAIKEDITQKKLLGQELDKHRHHLEELVMKRTAELAEARVRAEAANQAKSVFLANVSHEIRTPMNAIVGLTHLLQKGAPSPEQRDRLSKIAAAAHHLLSIINDVLDLSKIEAGRLELESTDFALDAVLDHVRSSIADQARAKDLQVDIDGPAEPLWLKGDPTRLRQALLNYAGNAVKFTDRGTIALRARVLQESGDEILLRFEVVDTGIGIAAEKMPRLFDVFEQGDPSTTRRYGGTGLGLSITGRLARLMGGEAGVDSVQGQGSTFWFTARLGRGHGVGLETDPTADGDEALPDWSHRNEPRPAPPSSDEQALPQRLAGRQVQAADIDDMRLADVIERLKAFLQAGDVAANVLACQEAALLSSGLGDAGQILLRRIAEFDHEGALSILRGAELT